MIREGLLASADHGLARRSASAAWAAARRAIGTRIRRARDIVEPDLLAKGRAGRIAAMFAECAKLDARARRAAALGGDLH